MTKQLHKLQAWEQTKTGHLVIVVAGLGLAYALASRAIETGSWWEYTGAVVCLVLAVRNLRQTFKRT